MCSRATFKCSALARRPITAAEVGNLEEVVSADGDLRTLPCHYPNADPKLGGLDGFYAARITRN